MFVVGANASEYYFFIQFTDKTNTPFSLHQPENYLSLRAIERRNAFQLAIDSTDLPVNEQYVAQVKSTGVTIHSRSKWMNGITIITSDSSIMSTIREMPFVRNTRYTGLKSSTTPTLLRSKWNNEADDYGLAFNQLKQVNGQRLHELGFTGEGILIGVLDAGFRNVNINPAFDSLRIKQKIVGHTSIINPQIDVFSEHTHGADVLSVMAGLLPGSYRGTAPDASFLLIQTEYAPTEHLVELDFWVRGIEFADSAGVDIVNSSLGYTEFDDSTHNLRYSDMNGTTTRASIAATMASAKGIIVCNSAGNSGNNRWKYIGAPADARGILTVGSVDNKGVASFFTSYGPSADGRIKPEVVATGTSTAVVKSNGVIGYSNGTSFSSPLMAGVVACYLQYLKEENKLLPVPDIIQTILASSHLYNSPQSQLGYGIPDFSKIPGLTTSIDLTRHRNTETYTLITDSYHRQIMLTPINAAGTISYRIVNSSGQEVVASHFINNQVSINLSHLASGIYLLIVQDTSGPRPHKIILQ